MVQEAKKAVKDIKEEISIQLFSNSLGEEEVSAVRNVFKSRWIGAGNETKMFEKELGEKIGSPNVLLTDTCTAALFMSMKILGIKQGDEVIIPSIHFIGAANAIIAAGAKPMFADVDLKTFNILPSEIERLKTNRTKAVMLLHYGGQPCELDKIMTIAKKHNLKVIEDNANSPFSKYSNQNCGTFGDISCMSFDAMKILAMGNGGAIVLKNKEMYNKTVEFRYFGLKNKGQSGIDNLKDKNKRWWEIELEEIAGRNINCDILSSIGRVQLKKVEGFIKRRKEIWGQFQKGLAGVKILELPPEPAANTKSSYYLYWVKVKGKKRDELANYLVSKGIYCSFRYYPLHLIKKYGYKSKKIANSEIIGETALNLPLHQNLSDADVAKIINAIKEFEKNQNPVRKKPLIDLIRVPDPTSIDDKLDEPLGLLYLSAVLRRAGYSVRITNLAGHTADSWKQEIKPADMYGIQLFTPTSHHGINIAKFIKQKFPGKFLMCGGPHPTAVPADPRLNIFDTIVIGEGEKVILQIVKDYESGKRPAKIIKGEAIEDLDSLPLPAWDLVDMMSFHRKIDGQRCFNILGSRGCCYQCAFCDRSLFGSKVRFRSIDNVVGEIKEIIKRYGVRHFDFVDDMFTVNKARLKEFVEKTRGLNLKYRCFGRADVHDVEIYKMLKESGCIMICFGIESGNQKMLDRMKKGTSVVQNLKAIKIAKDAGIHTTGFFIAGFPGETKQTIEESKDFVELSGLDQAQFYTFIPLPGNEVAKNPEKFGIKRMSKDYSQYFHVTGTEGLGGKTVDTEWLSADELEAEVRKIRVWLKNRVVRGNVQDYYKEKLGYKVHTS